MDMFRDKKEALLAKKQRVIQEIKYYESRIAETRKNSITRPHTSFSDDSSDSDNDMPKDLDIGQTTLQLKQKQIELRNCLNATQELCDIQVIESEVTVLTDEPQFERERPVSEPGLWKEVTAECSVDLIRIVLSFYMHIPERKFGPISFRGLRVKPIKHKHAIELDKSVLPDMTRPSDAVEVIRSYAVASRSRRETLARLLDKFPNDIVMDTKPDGGFIIECPLMKISWTLQNKWSPIAPFHHRLNIDVEYMDEKYVIPISQAHRQLSELDVDTDDRTMLLAKIINICLQAKGPTQELHESMSSDVEDPNYLEKLKIRLDKEPEAPGMHRKTKDSTVMAPPKTLPRKSKSKANRNTVENSKTDKTSKRSIQDGAEISAKNPKYHEEHVNDASNAQEIAKIIENIEKNQHSAKNRTDEKNTNTMDKKQKHNVASEKFETNVSAEKKKPVETSGNTVKNVAKSSGEVKKTTDNATRRDKTTDENKKSLAGPKNKEHIDNPNEIVSAKGKEPKNGVTENIKNTEKTAKKTAHANEKQIKENMAQIKKSTNSAGRLNNEAAESVATTKNTTNKVVNTNKNITTKTNLKQNNAASKDTKKKEIQQGKIVKKVLNESGNSKVLKVVKSGIVPKTVSNNLGTKKRPEETKKTVESTNALNSTFTTEKSNIATVKDKLPIIPTKAKSPTVVKKIHNNLIQPKKVSDKNKVASTINKPKHTAVSKNLPLKTFNNPKAGNIGLSAGKISKPGNIAKENKVQNKVLSKIPQKQLKSASEVILLKNPLRISPRKGLSKPSSSGFIKNKPLKPVSTTHIPRLASKPHTKVT